MERNFFKRIEVAFPIPDPKVKRRVMKEGLRPYLGDNCQAWGARRRQPLSPQEPPGQHAPRRPGDPALELTGSHDGEIRLPCPPARVAHRGQALLAVVESAPSVFIDGEPHVSFPSAACSSQPPSVPPSSPPAVVAVAVRPAPLSVTAAGDEQIFVKWDELSPA